MLNDLRRPLFAVDLLTVSFSAALALLALAFSSRIPHWRLVAGVSTAIVAGLPLLALARHQLRWRVLVFLHDWAFAPLAYVLYLEMQLVVGPIHGSWIIDDVLIRADRWLFGTDPGALLDRFATPLLTEILQIAYTSFYLLMVAVGAELWATRDRERFHFYAFSCAVGFITSFLGYLAAPAVGPRFTIFDYFTVARELPGLYLTPALRTFVDGGGLVPSGLPLDKVVALAPRDVFPSGHTMMTLIAIYWTWRFRERIRWVITVTGSLLIVGTVYLRYHYAVDVIAGAVLAACCLAVTPTLRAAIVKGSGIGDRGSGITAP